MPINLREELERGDRNLREQQAADQSARKRFFEGLDQESQSKSQSEAEKLDRLNRNFDAYLMPIFREVASVKKVPMRDPYEEGYIKRVFKWDSYPHGKDYPTQSGFIKRKKEQTSLYEDPVLEGLLYWGIQPDDERGHFWWSELGLRMDTRCLVVMAPPAGHYSSLLEFNLLIDGQYDLLQSEVVKRVSSSECVHNNIGYTQSNGMIDS